MSTSWLKGQLPCLLTQRRDGCGLPRVEGPHTRGTSLGGVQREQKIRKGHLPRVIYHQVYLYTKKTIEFCVALTAPGAAVEREANTSNYVKDFRSENSLLPGNGLSQGQINCLIFAEFARQRTARDSTAHIFAFSFSTLFRRVWVLIVRGRHRRQCMEVTLVSTRNKSIGPLSLHTLEHFSCANFISSCKSFHRFRRQAVARRGSPVFDLVHFGTWLTQCIYQLNQCIH